MIKVFEKNKNGKIEFTKDELEKLLNEVWWDGKSYSNTYSWYSPAPFNPWYSTTCSSAEVGISGTTTTGVTIKTKE